MKNGATPVSSGSWDQAHPSRALKPAVLSLSLLTIVAGTAVAPAMAAIAAAFPDASPTLIQMVTALPSLTIVCASLLTGWLASRISNRLLAGLGLLLAIIGGAGGGLAQSMTRLLVWRALLGLGIGMILPLSTSLIAAFWQGEERTHMMGLSIATSNLGGILTQWIASALALSGWRYAFLTHAMGLPVLWLVLCNVPEPPRIMPDRAQSTIPAITFLLALLLGMINIAFFVVPMHTALLLQEEGLGDSRTAGLVIIMASLGALLSGMSFSWLARRLRQYLVPLGTAWFWGGFACVSLNDSLFGAIAGMLIIGLGLGCLSAWFITKTTETVPAASTTRALSITTSALFLGQFLSPVVLGTAGRLFSITSNRCLFQLVTGATGIGFIAALLGAAILRDKMAIGISQAG